MSMSLRKAPAFQAPAFRWSFEASEIHVYAARLGAAAAAAAAA
jgi:hypothetical protein